MAAFDLALEQTSNSVAPAFSEIETGVLLSAVKHSFGKPL